MISARGEDDELVHLVAACAASRDAALVDPSPYRTRCGQRVAWLYNVAGEVTCAHCR